MRCTRRAILTALFVGICAASLPAQLSFEVASIRPSTSLGDGGSMGPKPGRFVAMNVPTVSLISVSHDLKFNQIIGGPDWIRIDRYNLEATTPEKVTWDELRPMLRSLLAERFKLRAHRETRARDGYALVRVSSDRLGPGIQPSALNCADPTAARPKGSRFMCGLTHVPGSFTGGDIKMPVLADVIAGAAGAPVVDRTGITGGFDVDLKWAAGLEPSDLPSIFAAVQEQLGLRLQREEMPGEVLVIDHIERPTEN